MNKKSEKAFLMAMTILGIVTGIEIVIILMAIAVPGMRPYLLTFAEKSDFEHMARYAALFSGPGMTALLLPALAIGICAVLLFLVVLNPHCMNGIRNWRSRAGVKLAVTTGAMLGWILVLAAAAGMSGSGSLQAVVQAMIFVGATALLWSIAGEMGWAGDLSSSSWALPSASGIQRSLLLGAAAGAMLFALDRLVEWSQSRYFILVSEVLDRSGETSFLGFQLLAAGIVGILGITFPVFGGFVIALAPVARTGSEVKQKLKPPAIALAVLVSVLLISYGYAGRKFDLDKKDLAGIIGVRSAASAGRTVVLLLPSKDMPVTMQDWSLQVSGSGFGVQSTIELSTENLGKVEAYLAGHPDGSVFAYAAREVLYKGYHALWDVKNGLAWQAKAARSQLIPRMMLLARFQVLPVTDGNVRLLEAFSDETVWSMGGKSALTIAKGYQHFGRTADAKRWLDKARLAGAEGITEDLLKGPVITEGTVRGRVLVNGSPPKDARIVLVGAPAQRAAKDAFSVTDLSLCRALVNANALSADGSFLFDRLGSGSYVVAVVVPRELLPATLQPGKLTARSVPGPVRIGPERMRDLGTIEIVFRP